MSDARVQKSEVYLPSSDSTASLLFRYRRLKKVPEELTLDSIRDIRLYQPKAGYRFSVDSILLFNFINLPRVKRIADLGAGCGIIGLLLARKYEKSIVTLFEIQRGLFEVAKKNIKTNSLQERMEAFNLDINEIPSLHPSLKSSFDIVVSNPPFRKMKSGRINPYEGKAIARHEIAIDLQGLVTASEFLLRPRGRIFLIYHPSRLSEVVKEFQKKGIEAKRLQFVHSNIFTEAKMVLVEGVKGGRTGLKVDKPFFIYNERGEYSEEMRYVYGDM